MIPVQRFDDYQPGDFSFIADPIERTYLTHDFKIVNDFGLWNRRGISKDIELFLWTSHTPQTLGRSLNTLKFILRNGWENYTFFKTP